MQEARDSMPAVLDRQISNEKQDAFGHRHFAQALRSLIESKCHTPPFSIGLLGGWGTGKSSIKELYIRSLEDDASKSVTGEPRMHRFKSITFNAWRFGGKDQDIKRALLRHVFLELGGDEQALHDRLFRNVTRSEEQWKGWREYTLQLWRAWAMPLPAFLAAMLVLFGLIMLGLKVLPWDTPYVQSAFVIAISGAYSYLLKHLKPSKIDSYRSITKVSLPSASTEQYEEMLLEQLKSFKQTGGLFKRSEVCERLVIFVDDLDRLSAEEMVLGLDAVRAFMEIPPEKLPPGLGLVFVISCDEAKVAYALANGRGNPEQPGTVFTHTDARRYLDRIFQFRLEIPPPPRSDMRQFALAHLSSFDEIAADLKARGSSPDQVIDRMIHVNVADPRNALQIVNAFAQSWWLAKRRELEGSAGDLPGGLHEHAVTGHPISLGALSAARVSFPDFYRDLQDDPQLLSRLTAILVNGDSVMEQPLEARPLLLKRYVTHDEEQGTRVRDGCRELRQFLASLVGVRWPDSLQSLLLLSEDPISRKFGAGASALHGLLMSGDTKGVIELLSPRVDKVVLSEDQAHLLHLMISDLHLETLSRRHNAMRVIANLLDYLPERTQRLILGPLCTELAGSVELRSMVGLPKIGSVMETANSQEQRQIAVELIEDLLTTNHQFEFRRETMQSPSLSEAKEMVLQASAIVLKVRQEHGLPDKQDRALIEWLKVRDLNTGTTPYHFGFGQLEEWLKNYEGMLISMLGNDYAALLAAEVEAGRGADIDLEVASRRIDGMFADLAQAGEQSRAALWPLVRQYLALPAAELKACALKLLEQSQQLADSKPLSDCIIGISDILITHPDPEVDYERGFQLLLSVASSRFSDLTAEAKSKLGFLANNLATGASYEDDAVALYEGVILREDALVSDVSTQWASTFGSTLPSKCCAALYRSYSRLPGAVRAQIAAYFDSGFNLPTLPSTFDELYSMAAQEILATCWSSGELKGHLNQALNALPSKVSSALPILETLLSGISKIYQHADPATVAASLKNTFANASNYPAQCNLLHQYFAGTWPTSEAAQSGYNPQVIFDAGVQLARRSPAEAKRGLLCSLESMLNTRLVGAENEKALIEVACIIWQSHPAEAQEFLARTTVALPVDQLAMLPGVINLGEASEVEWLERAWRNASKNLGSAERQAATLQIVAKAPISTNELPDQGLTLWALSLGKNSYEVLKQSVLTTEVADQSRRRLWRQILSLSAVQPAQELINLAIRLLVLPSAPETADSVSEDLKQLCQQVTDQDIRYRAATALLSCLPQCSSMAIKANLAHLALELGTQAVLRDVDASILGQQDLEVIEGRFGKGRELNKLKKRFEESR
ncbi:KAP family P-loop NTPase fold protein [Pseudomonas knackmussii]|uniref:KAP family P-loop NTPase fold protein n=1 Tax=Pseudomonas knackmussii TaxID=65741 RepID=UPI003BD61606